MNVNRKLRKNTREKQRRSELNDKFEILCAILGERSFVFVFFCWSFVFFFLLTPLA